MCDEIRPYILSKLIGLPSGSTGNHRTFVKLVYKTLISFITSRDKKILVGHIPVRKPNESVRVFSDAVIIREANRIWAKMSDPEDFEIKISHDGTNMLVVRPCKGMHAYLYSYRICQMFPTC